MDFVDPKCKCCASPFLVPYPSNVLKASSDAVATEATTSYVKKKEITTPAYFPIVAFLNAGKFRVVFELRNNGATSGEGRIYKNGVAVGTERTTTSATFQVYTEDLDFKKGDLIQLYAKRTGAAGQAEVQNFRIYNNAVCLECGYNDSQQQKSTW